MVKCITFILPLCITFVCHSVSLLFAVLYHFCLPFCITFVCLFVSYSFAALYHFSLPLCITFILQLCIIFVCRSVSLLFATLYHFCLPFCITFVCLFVPFLFAIDRNKKAKYYKLLVILDVHTKDTWLT